MVENKFGYTREGKVFLKGFLNLPDREIGKVRDDDASSFRYFEDRFEIIRKKVEDLQEQVESSDNKGSYLMKLIHLKKMVLEYNAIGDFASLYHQLEILEGHLKKLVAGNRMKNLEIKKDLLEEAMKFKDSGNWKKDTERIKELNDKWIKTGNVDKAYKAEIEGKFQYIIEGFFKRRTAFYERKYAIINQRVSALEKIIEKAKIAKGKDRAISELINLQKEWKKVGKIPGKERKKLWQEFRTINDQVFKTGKKGKMKKMSSMILAGKDLIKEKKALLEKAKSLTDQYDQSAVSLVKDLKRKWRGLGALPKENLSMSDDFYYSCDLVIEKFFLSELVKNRFKNFEQRDKEEQLQLKESVLKDLLIRDQAELEAFQENMKRVTVNTDGANQLMNAKLRSQTRKVRIKKAILEELKDKMRN